MLCRRCYSAIQSAVLTFSKHIANTQTLSEGRNPRKAIPSGRVFSGFDYAGGRSVPLETMPPGSDSPKVSATLLEASKQFACLWLVVEIGS